MKKFTLICMAISALAIAFLTSCGGKDPVKVEKLEAPQITPAEGVYQNSVEVTMSCSTQDATIYYSIDGSNPINGNNNVYLEPFTIEETTIVKAAAVKEGFDDSDITTVSYTIEKENTVSNPTFNYESGTYDNSISVEISCADEGATIYYTLDGSTPNTSSMSYKLPISITESCTIKARAFIDGMIPSNVVTAEYIIEKDFEGRFTFTDDISTNEYEIADFIKHNNESSFRLEFLSSQENVNININFRSDKLPIGEFEFSPYSSSITATAGENGASYIFKEGLITIEAVDVNKYSIVIKDALIETTNSLIPSKKIVYFEFCGVII